MLNFTHVCTNHTEIGSVEWICAMKAQVCGGLDEKWSVYDPCGLAYHDEAEVCNVHTQDRVTECNRGNHTY